MLTYLTVYDTQADSYANQCLRRGSVCFEQVRERIVYVQLVVVAEEFLGRGFLRPRWEVALGTYFTGGGH
jgi:hypothetical protein